MMTPESRELLQEYVRTRSEDAFRRLVDLHSPVVYGTALRRLNGSRAAAQDVTQEVFSLLARKADQLEHVVLGGWLYRQACRRAANLARSESRRRGRESAAMEALGNPGPDPLRTTAVPAEDLDAALLALPAKDRDALILRFFEGKEFKRVGVILGLGEEAARKRVSRALERLEGNLRRKGITCGTALLGQTITSHGQTSIPTGFSRQISEKALHSQNLAGSAVLAGMIWPALIGVAATSAIMVSARMMPELQESMPATTARIENSQGRSLPKEPPLPKELSLEQIVTELKRVRSKPSNSLTAMQLEDLLEKIGTTRIPEFLELSKGKLTMEEIADLHTRVFNQWMESEPGKALDYLIASGSGEDMNAWTGGNILNNLFQGWMYKDARGAESWLLKNWEHPQLSKSAFLGLIRGHLSVKIAGVRFNSGGISSVLEFVHQLPSEEGKLGALRGFTGLNSWEETWRRGDEKTWEAFHKALLTFPDTFARRELAANFWTMLSSEYPDKVLEMQRHMSPKDQFLISLGWLGAKTNPGTQTPTMGGGYLQKRVQVSDTADRQTAAVNAGLHAGLPPEQVFRDVACVLIKITPPPEFFKWLDAQPMRLELDEVLVSQAISKANAGGWSPGEEMAAVEWARRIQDDPLRHRISRAVFRKALARTPEAALSYLKNPELPAELAHILSLAAGEQP